MPDLNEEVILWERGYRFVAGLDEVGRGALAGPVMAAAVVLPADKHVALALAGVNDSKQVAKNQRPKLAETIQNVALGFGVGSASAHEIDEHGIAFATRLAMRRALDELQNAGTIADFLLLDYVSLDVKLPQKSIIKGDARSFSIAAASIVAKVTRDQWMTKLAEQYPAYGFEQNKGYGTEIHRHALAEMGASTEHRRTFRWALPPTLPLIGA